MRKEFEMMKKEDKWSKMLAKIEWPHFKTVHRYTVPKVMFLGVKSRILYLYFIDFLGTTHGCQLLITREMVSHRASSMSERNLDYMCA